jgi:protein-S-isoprenylcysteine O-methyltransferase
MNVRYSRHPSYCGFFYWAVLTQVLLGNVASTIAFVFILGNFFVKRIKGKLSS